jgi:hypothetical protein
MEKTLAPFAPYAYAIKAYVLSNVEGTQRRKRVISAEERNPSELHSVARV